MTSQQRMLVSQTAIKVNTITASIDLCSVPLTGHESPTLPCSYSVAVGIVRLAVLWPNGLTGHHGGKPYFEEGGLVERVCVRVSKCVSTTMCSSNVCQQDSWAVHFCNCYYLP